ncbi:MAG: hypothetical protein IPG66_12795 [Hydrogenophilales bacterium]|nr:hypothetical protein [Hydrogenophilales bacterium]
MNCEDILNILLERPGGINPDRGVAGDDILLSRWAGLDEDGRAEFWPNFCQAVAVLWHDQETEALEVAAAFVAGLGLETRTAEGFVEPLCFLLDEEDIKHGSVITGDGRRRVVAVLRILSKLGLGDRAWWRARFWCWIDEAAKAVDEDGLLAWQAVLHGSMGMMQAGEPIPQVDAWLEKAKKAKEFPAIELFSLLARQTAHQGDTKDFVSEVVEAYQSLRINCGQAGVCPEAINDIRMVIESWLLDPVVGYSPEKAAVQLQWKEPDKRLPQDRIFRRRPEPNHVNQ